MHMYVHVDVALVPVGAKSSQWILVPLAFLRPPSTSDPEAQQCDDVFAHMLLSVRLNRSTDSPEQKCTFCGLVPVGHAAF